jgi:nucleotide-binding universal stress UspA family protein
MFKRILVPLDGSPLAERAIPVAARIARTADATVVLVRVVRAPIEYESALITTPTWVPPADLKERDEATRDLAEAEARDDLSGLATERHVYAGAAGPVIRATAQTGAVDLIVMTQRGRGGLARLVLGSVTTAVVRAAETPVLVVRANDAHPRAVAAAPYTVVVLVALDGSPLAEAALEPAIQITTALSHPANPALHLLRIVDLGRGPGVVAFSAGVPDTMQRLSEARAQEVGEAETYLSNLAIHLKTSTPGAPTLSVTWSVERSSDIAGAIISATNISATNISATNGHENYGLVALATHGRGGIRRWLMGSVTETVLQQAQLPVLSVRPRGAPPAPDTAGGQEGGTPASS